MDGSLRLNVVSCKISSLPPMGLLRLGSVKLPEFYSVNLRGSSAKPTLLEISLELFSIGMCHATQQATLLTKLLVM